MKKNSEHWILKNLILGAAFVIGVPLIASIFLSIVTRHGNEIVLPDFTSMTFSEAVEVAGRDGIMLEIGDSVYIPKMQKDGVYSQNPKAGMKVKKGRHVVVNVNSRDPKYISMPSLVGFQLSRAKSELQSKGLKLGMLYYENDIATNNVLRQYSNGIQIAPGTKIKTGSTIDLAVGLNSYDCTTYVPKLIGRDYIGALDMIQDNSLNIGSVTFDNTVKSYSDRLQSVVYYQSPQFSGGRVRMGTKVNLKLTLDKSKLNK